MNSQASGCMKFYRTLCYYFFYEIQNRNINNYNKINPGLERHDSPIYSSTDVNYLKSLNMSNLIRYELAIFARVVSSLPFESPFVYNTRIPFCRFYKPFWFQGTNLFSRVDICIKCIYISTSYVRFRVLLAYWSCHN